ncbi:thioesterase family protein [Desertibacillus haloalkaliphilus]|uniref:thioesterase family protein n=1 Tax=Desertibacillus haloalkaliphilus TaxID=1328930 RepID=UPI001C274658|nr:thioesterase family protein [Desertibacillus haloalkaliphilus]MBU8906798.1 thioesterase family protein [Desertibacillus haloalkaliphilus]
MINECLLTEHVRTEWVDYNGHMNDAAYAQVFSFAIDRLMEEIGLDAKQREVHHYTMFTLENHICYLREAHEGEPLTVTLQLIDHDAKRLHLFFVLKNESDERLATSEQMVMGIDETSGRPAPFPEQVNGYVKEIAKRDKKKEIPKEVGRQIGIRR